MGTPNLECKFSLRYNDAQITCILMFNQYKILTITTYGNAYFQFSIYLYSLFRAKNRGIPFQLFSQRTELDNKCIQILFFSQEKL